MNPWEILGYVLGWSLLAFVGLVAIAVVTGLILGVVKAILEVGKDKSKNCKAKDLKR